MLLNYMDSNVVNATCPECGKVHVVKFSVDVCENYDSLEAELESVTVHCSCEYKLVITPVEAEIVVSVISVGVAPPRTKPGIEVGTVVVDTTDFQPYKVVSSKQYKNLGYIHKLVGVKDKSRNLVLADFNSTEHERLSSGKYLWKNN